MKHVHADSARKAPMPSKHHNFHANAAFKGDTLDKVAFRAGAVHWLGLYKTKEYGIPLMTQYEIPAKDGIPAQQALLLVRRKGFKGPGTAGNYDYDAVEKATLAYLDAVDADQCQVILFKEAPVDDVEDVLLMIREDQQDED